MNEFHIGTNRLLGILLAGVTLLLQALLARLTASLAANILALIVLVPWTVLLLICRRPTLRQLAGTAAATASMLLAFGLVFWVVDGGEGEASEPTFVSTADEESDPRFEMTGGELKISGVSAEVWGDVVLAICTTRKGAYTNDGYFALEDVGNVASVQGEWPEGDQSLTLYFTEPLNAPPAFCLLEGDEGDIGASPFCDTGDVTPLPPDAGEKSPIAVDQLCAEAKA